MSVRAGVAISHRDQLPSASRYELLVKIASGGMATVYVGRHSSAVGITRLVAIKRAHAHLLEDASFARMLIAEARLASRIHHPNVVAVHNVEEMEGELLLVMDYVEGAALCDLVGTEDDVPKPVPARIGIRVLLDACAGLHAAHELTDDDGRRLGIVHRDVSPHNILVGVDGVARLTDFGIAKSNTHTQSGGRTSTGALKGKVSYMAPEYVESGRLDLRSDVFSLGVVAWEMLTRRRLFRGATEVESLKLVIAAEVPRCSEVAPWLGTALDGVLAQALARRPEDRFSSAQAFAEAVETAARSDDLVAKHPDVAAFVRDVTSTALAERRTLIKKGESTKGSGQPAEPPAITGRGRDERTGSLVVEAPAASVAPTASAKTVVTKPSRAPWFLGAAVLVVPAAIFAPKLFASPAASPPAPSIPAAPTPAPTPTPTPTPVTSITEAAPSSAPPPSPSPIPTPTVKPHRPPVRPRAGAAAGTVVLPTPEPEKTADKAPPNPYAK